MIWKHDERVVVYPPYIDAARSVAKGRRIALEDAVEHPHALEVADACERALGMRCELEDKAYSRDFWCRGRVRVEWKRDDGSFVREELNTRGKLLRAIAAAVKAHPERGGKREAGDESEVYDATQGVRGIPEAGGGRGGAGAGAGEESGEGALRQEGEEGTEVRAFFRTSRVGVGN